MQTACRVAVVAGVTGRDAKEVYGLSISRYTWSGPCQSFVSVVKHLTASKSKLDNVELLRLTYPLPHHTPSGGGKLLGNVLILESLLQ